MALSVINDPRAARRIIISCEVCGAEVDDQQIAEGGGLLEMGWMRRFNNRPAVRRNEYFCPEHHPRKES